MKLYKIFLISVFVAFAGLSCRDSVSPTDFLNQAVYEQQQQLSEKYKNRRNAERVADFFGGFGLLGAKNVKEVTIRYINTEESDSVAVTEAVVFNPVTESFSHQIVDLEPGSYDYVIIAENNKGETIILQSGDFIFPDRITPPVIFRDDDTVAVDAISPGLQKDTRVSSPLMPIVPVEDNYTTAPSRTETAPATETAAPTSKAPPLSWVCCVDNSVPEVDDRNYMALEWAGCEEAGGVEVPWSPTCDEFNDDI